MGQADGPIVESGFSPVTFSLEPGEQYTVSVGNYQDITFHQWQDTGSTTAARQISTTESVSVTALYVSDEHPPPEEPPEEDPSGPAPVTHMEDTTATNSYGIYAAKPARAEYVTLTSTLVGKQVDEMTVALRRVGSVSGQVHVGVLNPDGSIRELFGTIDAASVPATGHPSSGVWPEFAQYTFTLPELYTVEAGDRIGVRYAEGGNSSNYIAVALDHDPADPFDGTSSYLQYYDTSWKQDGTDKDLWLILKQYKEGPPPPPPSHFLLKVEAARLDGTAVSGVYTAVLKDDEVQVAENTPLEFAAEQGTTTR